MNYLPHKLQTFAARPEGSDNPITMKNKPPTKSSKMTPADTDRIHDRLDSVADNLSDIKAISSANTSNIESLADTVALLLKRDLEMGHKTPCQTVTALNDRVTLMANNAQYKLTQDDQDKRDGKNVVLSILKYIACALIGMLLLKSTGV